MEFILKAYSINVRFDIPQGGTINVVAESEDHAKQKAMAQLANTRNPEIIDVVELPSIEPFVADAVTIN